MSKPMRGLVALLAVGLALFAAMSWMSEGIDLGFVTLKTATWAHELRPPPTNGATQASEPSDTDTASHVPALVAQMDTTPKNILFIGDSMLEGLGPRLAAYAQANGHTLTNVIWYSSTTEIWGSSSRLRQLIDTHHPDYIFVCLGANELFVRDIERKRQRHLDTMLQQIGDIPYVWIGPPNWKDDTGINCMLQASCAPGTFFLSKGQHFERGPDGAHPTHASAAAWCDRVCRWVVDSAAHRIRLEPPAQARARCRTIVYQPQR